MKKQIFILLIGVFCLILATQLVSAIGLAGTGLLVQGTYTPGETWSYYYEVRGETPIGGYVTVFAEGELAPWLHVSTDRIEGLGSFTVDLVMTDDPLPEAGRADGKVCVQEGQPENNGGVVALTKSCAVFEIKVLYDGIYPVMKFEKKVGTENADFTITITNNGKEDISASSAKLEILDLDGSLLEVESFNGEGILSQKSETFTYSLDITDYTPGTYMAKAYVSTDDQELEEELEFTVGSFDVSLSDYTSELELNGIQKFTFTAKNEWAAAQSISAVLKLGGNSYSAQQASIGAWTEHDFEVYVDTTGFEVGEYSGTITFTLDDGTEKTEDVVVNFVEPIAADEEASGSGAGLSLVAIVVIVVVLILIVMGVLVYLKNKGDSEEGDF